MGGRVSVSLQAVRRASLALLVMAGLVACGGGKTPSTQVAAKVNKEEISVHQINFLLQQQRVRADQSDRVGRQVLERLIDQELAIQRAAELRIDRDPQVVQQLEAARREIVARAYVERIAGAAARPRAEDVSRYYAGQPALFRERRVYALQEVAVEVPADQAEALRGRLVGLGSGAQMMESLRSSGVRFTATDAVRAAEQLPLGSVEAFARLQEGDAVVNVVPSGLQLVILAGVRAHPVDEASARPAIEQFLLNESRRQLIDDDIKRLRSGAKIEYVGRFGESAGATGAPPVPPAPGLASAPLDAGAIQSGMGLK